MKVMKKTFPISKKFIGLIFPHYSKYLDEINRNVLFVRWANENSDCAAFEHKGGERYESRSSKVIEMYTYLNDLVSNHGREPIDFLEFGVSHGKSLRLWTAINSHAGSRFYGFDSFEGLPEDWVSGRGFFRKGYFSTDGKLPDIDENRIRYVKGLFQDTLSSFLDDYEPQKNRVVHVDCDLYSSTLFVLTQLDLILGGSIIIFDEFDKILHEFQAFQDYIRSYRRTYEPIARVDFFRKFAVRITERKSSIGA